MDKIITYFPQAFYISTNLLEVDYLQHLQERARVIKSNNNSGGENWILRPYNTLGTYELKNDPNFKLLLQTIENKVFEFSKAHNSDFRYTIHESWLNVYNKDDEQEFHFHSGNTFSAVFFLKSTPTCAKLVFESPTEPDMKPIVNINNCNELSFKRCTFEPIENSLIIFRSYMRHMVEKQKTDFERMTVAVNL